MKLRNLTLIVLSVMAFTGCMQQKAQESEARVEQVETTKIKKIVIARQSEFSTTLEGYETMNIAPSVTGKIEHIFVEVGTNVQAGDMLVRMDQNQYNTAKLAYTNLTIEMQRMDALNESGAVSKQTYDQTKLSFDQAKESLSFLTTNTYVKARFSGVISAKNYEDGELYSGQPILVLTQIYTLKALINIPETYFPLVKKGMALNIYSDIYPGEVFPATIEIVYPTVDAASHTFQAKLRIPNGKLKLRPGMYVRTTMEMGEVETIVVPYQSVLKLTGSNERFVYINDNGAAKRIFVTLGQRFDDKVEIISSEIAEGDDLVTVGQSKLVDGAKMNVVKVN
ncbi:MAG: efflux RND transporter periplasmic adaptor subunit [Bacteroidales bacterium]|nr:efflux RND transporter periplasmic adaptor subunit [Bacteroidales bacterium]MDD3200666.1 efflux RND transporter periplasmic adaptor subunit [Bacteroidales bacterium]